ncbi:primosomal protein N' [Alphaproteobacteria bacterium]|nr:primosomal protein N' [Alphaproteobacteria bacterium]
MEGQLVAVNFRNREEIGVIVAQEPPEFSGTIKEINAILPYNINKEYIKFARFVASYNLTKFGKVLKLLIPFSINKLLLPEKQIKEKSFEKENAILNKEQEEAVAKMLKFVDNFKVILLHGITGSGKTEVFLEFAKSIVNEKKQILIMVPEISLSDELSEKVSKRLGLKCHIWHNSVTPTKKLSIWKKIADGEQICIVGARSALFVPFKNLGCIIIDEEHDQSYKQNETIVYHARDMAIYLGQCLGIPVILSSATPSIESYNNCLIKKYEYIKINSRYFENAKLPSVYIDDMRTHKSRSILSPRSIVEIEKCLNSGKQALIFVNRRGHTPKILCKSCGWKMECPGCSSWLCYHCLTNELICHHCGHKAELKEKCGECGKSSLTGIGAGVEKVSLECTEIFPTTRILTLSSDTINTPNKISKALSLIKNKQVDLIVGTQIVSKGHNFNDLNLAVITSIDSMLYGDDFRSIERAFQIIQQVSGRAGRSGTGEGKVIIQTYNPSDKFIKLIEKNDTEEFYNIEIANRKLTKMPPFGKLASLTLSGFNEAEVSRFAKKLIQLAPRQNGIKILGPIQPILFKLRSKYRLKIYVFSTQNLQPYISQLLTSTKIPPNITTNTDFTPTEFG